MVNSKKISPSNNLNKSDLLNKNNNSNLLNKNNNSNLLNKNNNMSSLNNKSNLDQTKSIKNLLIIFIIILILIIISLSIFLVINIEQNNELKKEFENYKIKTENDILTLENNLSNLREEKQELELNLINLNKKYETLKNSNQSLNKDYETLKNEAENTIKKINDYEEELQSSIDWFKTNSILPEDQSSLKNRLISNCRKKNSTSCEINLGCIFLINSEYKHFEYIDDELTSNEIDKLQSIDEFISNKGGDCEDFSLMFKAEYNSMIKDCKDNNLEIKPISWKDFETTKKFWLNNSKTWYFDDAKEVKLENSYPNIVCGNIFDLQSGKINGHCVIAFTKNKINSTLDIFQIKNAELVEPQNGKYLGKVGNDSNIYLISDEYNLSFINTIITENDYYHYSNNEDTWQSYFKFSLELKEKQNSLNNLILEAK